MKEKTKEQKNERNKAKRRRQILAGTRPAQERKNMSAWKKRQRRAEYERLRAEKTGL